MEQEESYHSLSALQHLAFCERQCALIHLEQQWEENRLTAEGRVLHERAHEGEAETRPGVHTARGLRLVSHELKLVGQADVVEFHGPAAAGEGLVRLEDREGWWRVCPVEYKRGKPKVDLCDEVQLCAQAMCLEEMLGAGITEGAVFYGRPRRRQKVEFNLKLREETRAYARRLDELLRNRVTPAAVSGPHCRSCSLESRCLPWVGGRDARAYLKREIVRILQSSGTDGTEGE